MVPANLAELRRRVDAGESFEYLPFYGHAPDPSGAMTSTCLSQWFWAPFEHEGVTYPTAEHFMMAEKARLFGDTEYEALILQASSPHDAKMLGRQVRRFDESVWKKHRFEIVAQASRAKFGAHAPLRAFLLGTNDQILVEASARDRIWGIGLGASNPLVSDPGAWRGLNLLGFALMRARADLR